MLGPLTRLAYLLFLLSWVGLGLVALEALEWVSWKDGPGPQAVGAGALGYFAAQWLHLGLDALYARPRGRPPSQRRVRSATR